MVARRTIAWRIVVRGRAVGHGDDMKAGAFRRERARPRILKRDRLVAAHAEAIQHEFVEIGLGLG
jgi:hypothetical protein